MPHYPLTNLQKEVAQNRHQRRWPGRQTPSPRLVITPAVIVTVIITIIVRRFRPGIRRLVGVLRRLGRLAWVL